MLTYTAISDDEVNSWYKDGIIITPRLEGPFNSPVQVSLGEAVEYGLFRNGKIQKRAFPEAFGVKPKNKEQHGAMLTLLENDIPMKIITGKEGTGKNFITAACLLELLVGGRAGKYKKLVLTRTTDEVGKSLGLMPGSVDEKFGVHVNSFKYTMAAVMGKGASYLDAMLANGDISYMPIQFMRGVSFPPGTIVWADEIAGLSPFELRMLCTRLGEGCLLVLTGSLEQIDRKSAKHETGLYRLINSPLIQRSYLASHVELIENERSPLSALISEVL